MVAHRTSPTNLGLYLLAVVAARDFGWLGTLDCVERLEATLATIRGLERFQGHFFNWYDTRTVLPLEPRYVSTVDSGNLAGHLVALAEACRQLAESAPHNVQALAGIADAIALIRVSAPASAGRRTQTVTRRQLDEALDALDSPALRPVSGTDDPDRWAHLLSELSHGLHAVEDVARALAGEQAESADAAAWKEALDWSELAEACVASHVKDLAAFASEQTAGALVRRLLALADTADELSAAMQFGFLFDPSRKLFAIGYRVAEGGARSELLRPAGFRSPPGELHRHCQGGCPRGALVPARPALDAGRPRRGAHLLVGLDVRVSDAGAGDALSRAQLARPDLPPGGAAPDPVRRRAQGAMGCLGVGVQRA